MTKLPWKTIKKNIIYQNKYGYTLWDNDVINPCGNPGKYMVMEGSNFIVIFAINANKEVLLIRQSRYTIGRELLELPSGGIMPNETPLAAAKRELLEESGATSTDWTEMKSCWSLKGGHKQKGHYFIAKNFIIENPSDQEETENISVSLTKLDQLKKLLKTSEIEDAETILGILLSEKYL